MFTTTVVVVNILIYHSVSYRQHQSMLKKRNDTNKRKDEMSNKQTNKVLVKHINDIGSNRSADNLKSTTITRYEPASLRE